MVKSLGKLRWAFAGVAGLGLLLTAALFFARTPSAPVKAPNLGPDKPLVIYAYSSFTDFWGPGPKLVQSFQSQCGCMVELVDAGDSAVLLERIKTEGNLSRADLVIGLDQIALVEAVKLPGWKPLKSFNVKWSKSLSSEHRNPGPFVAFDWAPMTFIYRKGEVEPPTSLDDLLDSRFKNRISLMDPRTSSGGLQFLTWIISQMGPLKGRQFLEKLKPNIYAISPGWSAAYGLFKAKKAALAFSYLTSPAYHWIEEKNEAYQPALFREPTPFQVEFAGIPSTSHQAELAEEFLAFLLTEGSQKILAESNFMLPVVDGVTLNPAFQKLPEPVSGFHWSFRSEELTSFVNVWKEVFH